VASEELGQIYLVSQLVGEHYNQSMLLRLSVACHTFSRLGKSFWLCKRLKLKEADEGPYQTGQNDIGKTSAVLTAPAAQRNRTDLLSHQRIEKHPKAIVPKA
jgi:hypothetical protein